MSVTVTSGMGGKGTTSIKMASVLVGELARRVGRSSDTIKRWLEEGLLDCERDDRNRRVFADRHVERCLELARLSVSAQVQNKKLSELANELPRQLALDVDAKK
jgi:DNA-binding transcriptional MerR regulator